MATRNDRYAPQCAKCPDWKYLCWTLAPGTIEQVKKCDIYLRHEAQVKSNWQALGIKS